jgi:hypothetical protein
VFPQTVQVDYIVGAASLERIERAKPFQRPFVPTDTQMKITPDHAPVLDDQKRPFLADGMILVLLLALANFLLHLYFNNQYGYFRDEFNYMACGDHLAWGYVDHPPLIPFLIKLSRLLLGDSLRSIRIVPALATSAAVILTALIARELGGRRFAIAFSALAFMAVPFYLNDGSVMTTNCLEPLLWMGCVYFAILAIKRGDPRNWLWVGVVAGIGLEEKYSIAVLGFAIVAGLLLWVASGSQRTPDLFSVGSARVFGKLPDRAGRFEGISRKPF